MKKFLRNSLSVACKVMKYSMMIMTVVCSLSTMLMASTANAQKLEKATVSLSADGKNISAILAEIETKTQLKFVYNPGHLKRDVIKGKIFKNEKVELLLQKLGYTAREEGRSIIVTRLPVPQQPGRITGKIVDDRGESLPGASIKIIETGQTLQTSVDGTYNISTKPGTYTLEVSYISFQTKRIADVLVKTGEVTKLDVLLKVASSSLKEVVVKSSYKKESVAGLYAQQKNAASVTDGISAEQIAKTSDNNMGQVLKRVSGLTTVDNKYVVVRGLSERYNQALIDGVVIPSTDMNRRNFSFDVIPQELVSSVVVNKTATPDMSSEFAGGQVTINTLDIPQENFTSIAIGTGYNDRTTGKTFEHAGEMGKYDFLGFDDGTREFPKGVNKESYKQDMAGQSKLFNNDAYRIHEYKANPNQNYRFSLGRIYDLNEKLKFGFTGGLTYRNTQETNWIDNDRGQTVEALLDKGGEGNIYRFNTTLGAVLNAGIQGEKFKLASKNYYSRIFNDNFYNTLGINLENSDKYKGLFADPQYTTIYQNKLEGEHTAGDKGLKINWNVAITNIDQGNEDRRRFKYRLTTVSEGKEYYQTPDVFSPNTNGSDFDYRLWTKTKETDYNWNVSATQPFNFLKDKSSVKVGYTGWYKKRSLTSSQVNTYTSVNTPLNFFNDPYDVILAPDQIGTGTGQAFYNLFTFQNNEYNGNSKYHAAYLMLDQRFFNKLRLVYGIRAENFNLKNRQEAFMKQVAEGTLNSSELPVTGEKNWSFLPSVNITYSLNTQMNIRAAFATTMVRPDFRETSYFELYDPFLDGYINGWNVVSTKIQNFDLRYEWYPSTGEIISVSGFYKKFDKPLELKRQPSQSRPYYRFENQDWAENIGIEMEIRKSLGFIADKQWLRNLTLFGNGTLMRSTVAAIDYRYEAGELITRPSAGLKRPLYGQSPWIINAGINYDSKYIGFNASYNRSGERVYNLFSQPNFNEYENGRDLVDLQISGRFLKQKAEIKLNISNLLDAESIYYINYAQYDDSGKSVNGTNGYEKDKGDIVQYRIKYGRTASLAFTYKF